MPRTITGSVGVNGLNQSPDVQTVQELLNNVPSAQGGPREALDPDGKIGPLTRGSIHDFQLFHFGWSGADGRVDPDHQTLDKLNEFSPDPGTLPTPPAPPQISPLSTSFAIQRVGNEAVFGSIKPSDLFFHVIDITNNRDAFYQLVTGGQSGGGSPPGTADFLGRFATFKSKQPHPVQGFDCQAAYLTTETISLGGGKGTTIASKLFLAVVGDALVVPMQTHLFQQSTNPNAGGLSTSISGQFVLVG